MKTWLTALFLCAAMFAFGQGTAARRDANLSDMVSVNTARSNILAHIATNITVGTIPDSRFPVVLQSLATNNAATLTNVPWATGISGIPAGFADGVDDTAVGAATTFTNATIGFGDEYRTNYISIATAGATNVGTLYSTRFGIADAVLNSWDDVTNYFGQTEVVASTTIDVATNGLERTVSLSAGTTNWIQQMIASVNQHFYFTTVTQSFGITAATNCFTAIDSPLAAAGTNLVSVNGSANAYFLSYVSTNTISRLETGPMEVDFYYFLSGAGPPTVTGHPEVYVWLTNDTIVEVATSGDTVYSGATVQRARVAMNVATSTNLPYGSRLMLRMKVTSETGTPTFGFVLGGDYDSHIAMNVGAIASLAQTNILGSFSNSYNIGTINSSNVFQIQTTNATLAFQVSTNADIRMVGNAFLSGGAVLGDSMEGDAVDIILTGGGSFIGDGGQLTGLNPTNINSGYSSGLSIGGNAATATTAATANAGDSATAFFSAGQLQPALFASNAASANLILKATSATTAAWSAEAAGPTNIVNDGEYVRITDTNGVTRFQVNSNWTRLIDGDGNVVLVATDSYGSQLQSGNNTYITLTNNAGIFYKATMHTFNGDVSFQNISFQTATFTNAVFATNMPPATITGGDGAVVWNSNNAALYWVSYGNDGNPVATNAFGTGAATASTNLSNLTVTNSFIGTNVQTAGLTNNGTARVNGDLTVTGTITSDTVDFTTMNVTNMVLTAFTNTPFLGVDENGLIAAVYDGNSLTNLNGTNIVVDAAGFNGNLATTDTNLQQIAQALDDLVVDGGTGSSNITDNGYVAEISNATIATNLIVQTDNIGAVSTAPRLFLTNGTLATVGAQQYSPVLMMGGHGWGTGGGASQPVMMGFQTLPIQGTTASGRLYVISSLNGAAPSATSIYFNSAGTIVGGVINVSNESTANNFIANSNAKLLSPADGVAIVAPANTATVKPVLVLGTQASTSGAGAAWTTTNWPALRVIGATNDIMLGFMRGTNQPLTASSTNNVIDILSGGHEIGTNAAPPTAAQSYGGMYLWNSNGTGLYLIKSGPNSTAWTSTNVLSGP